MKVVSIEEKYRNEWTSCPQNSAHSERARELSDMFTPPKQAIYTQKVHRKLTIPISKNLSKISTKCRHTKKQLSWDKKSKDRQITNYIPQRVDVFTAFSFKIHTISPRSKTRKLQKQHTSRRILPSTLY